MIEHVPGGQDLCFSWPDSRTVALSNAVRSSLLAGFTARASNITGLYNLRFSITMPGYAESYDRLSVVTFGLVYFVGGCDADPEFPSGLKLIVYEEGRVESLDTRPLL